MNIKNLILYSVIISITSLAMGNITIADHGGSKYTIVIPSQAPVSLQEAAKELQLDIKLASSANLPIVKDSQNISSPFISLGMTKQAQDAGFSVKGMEAEAYRIASKDKNLYIFGPDTPEGKWTANGGVSKGTANGVYTFLEDYLNVMWLMPGKIGRDVPLQKNFTLPVLNIKGEPQLKMRILGHLWFYTNGHQRKLVEQWMDHLRVGRQNSSTRCNYGASFWRTINGSGSTNVHSKKVKKLYKEHPQWFAMNAKGQRPAPKRKFNKLETTNPQLIQWFAHQAIKSMKASDKHRGYSLSPSDGRYWSKSPASKKWYDPSPAEQFGNNAYSHKPSMSSLVLKWYHDVAKIVKDKYPQGKLAGYFYAQYLYPPVKYQMKLPDNFTPVIAVSPAYTFHLYKPAVQKLCRQVISAWKTVAPSQWIYYNFPTTLLWQRKAIIGPDSFPGSSGNLLPAAPDIVKFMSDTLAKYHFTGVMICGLASWSDSAMSNYLLAKMEWNPTLNPYQMQHEWLTRAYGAQAGAVMAKFYHNLNAWFSAYYQSHTDIPGQQLTLDMLKHIYAAHYSQMEQLLIKALHQPMTQKQKQRLNLIKYNLIVLQWRLRQVGFLPHDLNSPLYRNDTQINVLLNKSNPAFPLFPGIVNTDVSSWRKPKPFSWKVEYNASPPPQAVSKTLPDQIDGDTFLIYAKQNSKIEITPKIVKNGPYFATYQIKNSDAKIIQSGLLVKNTSITIPAQARQAYYLRLTPRKPVNYVLEVANSAIAQGSYNKTSKTLTLTSDEDEPILVFHAPGKTPNGMMQDGQTVKIIKPFIGAKIKAQQIGTGKYTHVRIKASLVNGWKFHKDPNNTLISKGVTQTGFDDSSWTPISVLTWWQYQGIEKLKNYHGTGWYRVTFNLPPTRKGEQARIYFGSVDGNAIIYFNGHQIQDHQVGPAPDYKGWNKPFSRYLRASWLKTKNNVLVVKVTGKNNTGGSGIIGGVAIWGRMKKK